MLTFIGICGGSSSGKTTISNYLFNYIKNTTQISLDNYTHVLNIMVIINLEKNI